jgi:hypothetical protein
MTSCSISQWSVKSATIFFNLEFSSFSASAVAFHPTPARHTFSSG